MAWVKQKYQHQELSVELLEDTVDIVLDGERLELDPLSRDDAHSWAMMLRRAARRLEEIGKGFTHE